MNINEKRKEPADANRKAPRKYRLHHYFNTRKKAIKEAAMILLYLFALLMVIGLTGAAENDAITMRQYVMSVLSIGTFCYCVYLIAYAVPTIGRK